MRDKVYKIIRLIPFFTIVLSTLNAHAGVDEFTASKRADGGYNLNIKYSKRHWKPITAEGFFPIEKRSYIIEIPGKGEKWNNRNQKGTFYSITDIFSNSKDWDIGYAWVDDEGKNLYLNFFWVAAPDNLIPSDINGKYELSDGMNK